MSFVMFSGLTDVIGTLAACLTTASFVPQVWLSFKTRDVSGVSLSMYSVFTVGVALWLAYGLLLGAWPVVIANIITLVLALLILAMKLKYGGKPAAPSASALSSTPAPERSVCGK